VKDLPPGVTAEQARQLMIELWRARIALIVKAAAAWSAEHEQDEVAA
jgi:hypothetical protein